MSRAAFLGNPNTTLDLRFADAEAAAKSLGIALLRVDAAWALAVGCGRPAEDHGGHRMLIAYRTGDRAVFLYGFAKNERENIGPDELLSGLKRSAPDSAVMVFSRMPIFEMSTSTLSPAFMKS